MGAERYSTWMVPLWLVVDSRKTIQYRSGRVPASYLRGGTSGRQGNDECRFKFRKDGCMISRCAIPQCNASLQRLREGNLFSSEARQIFTLPEGPLLTKGSSSCELLVVSEMCHVHDIRIQRWSGGDRGSQEMNGEATAINWIFLESLAGCFRWSRAGVRRCDAV
jgi:hypothetical protein